MNKDKIRRLKEDIIQFPKETNEHAILFLCDALLEEDEPTEDDGTLVPLPPKQPSLLPCPSCGGEAKWVESDSNLGVIRTHVKCSSLSCQLSGPMLDITGEKWNALPRKGGLFSERMVQVACKDREDAVNQRWIVAVQQQRWPADKHRIEREVNASLDLILRDMGVEEDTP